MKKLSLIISIFILLILAAGCGGGIQTLNVNLNCDSDCNESNAIVVKIYQLKNIEKFRHASFESLLRNPDETLADDLLINSKYEKTMVPDETFQLKDLEINKDAAYLGVVADFHSPAKDGWQQVIPIDPDLENLVIQIHKNSLSLKEAD